ncbi:UDP-3-O-acyl-N-acetylglucosamine deacetylase [Hyphococcus formosus]|uniref:UDP-3-O-acyl-N-acetylglucosamine deacetylase n=1 Tax=Hyphococcus formosus TaxID=3143534 RepID=UPI00398B1B03
MSYKSSRQHTVQSEIRFSGIGLHTGVDCLAVVRPASANAGLVFRRVDVTDENNVIPAKPNNVMLASHGTTISNENGCSVSTIEHLLAALALCGVDNAIVDVTGPEIPIFDGSAAHFVCAIRKAGTRAQDDDRQPIVVDQPLKVVDGERWVEVKPSDDRIIDIEIDFGDCLIGRQSLTIDLDDPLIVEKLSSARTFCRLNEVEALRGVGLILGGSLSNSLVVDGDRLLNEEPLRDEAEFVLHKALDLIGDLYLLGAPLVGHIRAVRPGHDLNTRLAQAVSRENRAMAQPIAQEPVRATA